MIVDARIPRPLYDPHQWQGLERGSGVVLDLSLAAQAGGYLKRWLETARDMSQVYWFLDDEWLKPQAEFRFALIKSEMKRWLERTPRSRLAVESGLIAFACKTFELEPTRVCSVRELPIDAKISLASWIEAAFGDSLASLSEFERKKLVMSFETQIGFLYSWFDLGLFVAWVRKQLGKSDFSDRLAMTWAKTAAANLPFDLTSSQGLVFNPTAQLVRQGDKATATVFAVSRKRNLEIVTDELNWREAALIDEVQENPRIEESKLLAIATHEHRNSESVLGKTISFEHALQNLIAKEIILRN